jgi:hypothetical protein
MSYDLFSMLDGNLLKTHGPRECAGQYCSLHNPSLHHMRTWRLNWRSDRGLMERICSHGIGHPDPDDIAFKHRACGAHYAEGAALHGCDGCCVATKPSSVQHIQQLMPDFRPHWYEKAWWAWLAFWEWVKSFFAHG